LLGRGAMGQVFRGTVRGSGAPVAVKVLKPELVSDTEVVARFFRERSILTSIDHPNVAKVLDLVVEGDTLGIVMELAEGQDLRRYLRARGTLPPGEAARLVCQLLEGLAAVHAGGVVHRDVKPENLLVSTAGGQMGLKLTDFGVSRLSYGASLTRMTSLIGTPEYMAPELAENDTATPAADLYSAGIVLYEMLAGRTPFAGGHPLAVLRRQVEQPPPPVPGAPAELWQLIESLLAKDPQSRPGSAAAALVRLAPLPNRLHGIPALPPMPNQPPPGQTMPGRASGPATPAREPGPTVLRARDRGLAPAGETGPPPVVSGRAGHGRARAQRRRRAAIISLPATLVILAAAVGFLLTRSPHGAAPVSDSQTAATHDVSLRGRPTLANTATGSATSRPPQVQATSQAPSPADSSAPPVTPQTSAAGGSAVNTAPAVADFQSVCGTSCFGLYSPSYGGSEVLGVVGAEQNTGQPVDLQAANGSNKAEDWVTAYTGSVSNFYASGLVSAAIDQEYRNNVAFEYQYSPFGVDSGYCLGVSGVAHNGTAVTLQPCGVSDATVWVSDTADQDGQQVPLINATDTDFTQPFVLTANGASTNVTTSSLTGTSGDQNGQYWSTEK
jgi:Protein kinase domain